MKKIYVVMIMWKENNYVADNTDIRPEIAFITKEKAQRYCDKKNERIKQDILEDLEIPYHDDELKEFMEEVGYWKYYIEEIELKNF